MCIHILQLLKLSWLRRSFDSWSKSLSQLSESTSPPLPLSSPPPGSCGPLIYHVSSPRGEVEERDQTMVDKESSIYTLKRQSHSIVDKLKVCAWNSCPAESTEHNLSTDCVGHCRCQRLHDCPTAPPAQDRAGQTEDLRTADSGPGSKGAACIRPISKNHNQLGPCKIIKVLLNKLIKTTITLLLQNLNHNHSATSIHCNK